jgi:hypothetical protein
MVALKGADKLVVHMKALIVRIELGAHFQETLAMFIVIGSQMDRGCQTK